MATHHGRQDGPHAGQLSGHASDHGQPHECTATNRQRGEAGTHSSASQGEQANRNKTVSDRPAAPRKRRSRPGPKRPAGPVKAIDRKETVGIVVDVQNLFHSSINIHDGRVNFRELMEVAASGRRVCKAIAYVVESPDCKECSFFHALERCGFELKTRRLQVFSSTGDMKGNWDVGIALDAYDLFLEMDVDTIVLVSGDGDFIDLVDKLHDRGGRCEVVSFRESTSHKLIRAADRYINLSDNPKRFVLQNHHNR